LSDSTLGKMTVTAFIGDEVSAAGYRLCGAVVHVADRRNVSALIEQAMLSASLVLIGSRTASLLPAAELEKLMQRLTPAVLVVPDVNGRAAVPDIAASIHKQLGMLE
jgi:vacuolar-type H+-ATPase subunit F/Vma7